MTTDIDAQTESPLAELWEADLDPEMLRKLFNDLGAVATVHALRIRRGPGYSGPAVDKDLSRARLLLESGAIGALQISYTHEGCLWLDTLFKQGPAVRLVRTRAP